MIKAHCFEKAWIDTFKAQEKYRRLNPPVLEKRIVDTSNFTRWQLDILFEDPHYPKIQERPITSPWIETEEIIMVTVPTVESNEAIDLDEIHSSFHAFVSREIGYRGLHIGAEKVLRDIIETSKLIAIGARLKASDQPAKNNYDLLIKGIRAFESFLIEGHFRLDDAILAGAKASNTHWNALNRLKRLPEAYFYWNKTLTLLGVANRVLS